MYFKRKIDDFLLNWKEDILHKPLIIKGARQIGKTESILHFAGNVYANVVYINFVLDKRFRAIVSDGYDVDTVIKNISLVDPNLKFVPGETVIIFDEIQEYPDVATCLKSFNIDRRFDIICSGSMLGINYKKIHSNSVGNKTDYEMYSMDFEEFLWAKGYTQEHIDDILRHMIELKPFNETELNVYKALFLDYCVLGGMPDVIRGYIETGTFSGSTAVQEQIRLDYEEDVRKYAEGLDQAKIISVYRSVPSQLAKENKKFQFNKIDKNARSREDTECLLDKNVYSYCIDADNNKLYYSGLGDGIIYEYDLGSGKSESIYESDNDTGYFYITFDGNYIWMDDEGYKNMAMYFNKQSSSLDYTLYQLDRDGKLAAKRTIPDEEKIFSIMHGDSSRMFMFSFVNNKIVYIDKSNIEKGDIKELR